MGLTDMEPGVHVVFLVLPVVRWRFEWLPYVVL